MQGLLGEVDVILSNLFQVTVENFGATEVLELVPNGMDICVDNSNRYFYRLFQVLLIELLLSDKVGLNVKWIDLIQSF